MDATTLSITLSAILAVICTPCGLFLGLVPMKADLVTAKQSKASQMVSFIVAIVFIGLLVAGHDLETWAMVIGLVIASPLPRSPHCTPGLCTSGRSSNPRKWLPPPSASRKPGRSKLWPYLFAESGISTSVSRFFIGRTYPLSTSPNHIVEIHPKSGLISRRTYTGIHPSRQTEKGRCVQQRPFRRRNGTQVHPRGHRAGPEPGLAQPFFFLESRS